MRGGSTRTWQERDDLLWSWPSLCKAVKEEGVKGCALSLTKHSKRRNWAPTPKQYALMNRLVADLYESRGDFDLIED